MAEMQGTDYASMAERARKKTDDRKNLTEKRVVLAREFLTKLVTAFLAIDADIETIVLFGSLAEKTVRGPDFDIDIAVRSTKYLKLVAWALNQDIKIDVIDLDSAPSHIVERIKTRGEVLYVGDT